MTMLPRMRKLGQNMNELGPLAIYSTSSGRRFNQQGKSTAQIQEMQPAVGEGSTSKVNLLPRFKKCAQIGIKLSQRPNNSVLLDKIGLLNKDSIHIWQNSAAKQNNSAAIKELSYQQEISATRR